jgi:hypothetical protein
LKPPNLKKPRSLNFNKSNIKVGIKKKLQKEDFKENIAIKITRIQFEKKNWTMNNFVMKG